MSSFGQQREHKQTSSLLAIGRDFASVGALGILLLCIHELANPFTRGFQCDDETIRYPYKDSTVSSRLCYFTGMMLNVFLILVFEYDAMKRAAVDSSGTNRGESEAFQMRLYIRNVYCRLMIWFFGAITSELLTDISKVTAGRLRPHFIDVCKPIIEVDNSVVKPLDEYCLEAKDRYLYITNYHCSGKASMLRDARLSFLSGHSSFSSYSAASAVFYIQSVVDVNRFGLMKPASQVLIASMAFYTGLTRVSDYKHHWQDVLAGLSLGTLVATAVAKCIWPSFSRSYPRMANGSARSSSDQVGDELNRVNY